MNPDELVRLSDGGDMARTDAWILYEAECIKTNQARLEAARDYSKNCAKIAEKALKRIE